MSFRNDYAAGQKDERPWGSWEVLDAGPGWCVKRITVKPGGILSLQRHRHRAEVWTVAAGTARVTQDGRVSDLPAGQTTEHAVGVVHRVENPGAVPLVFIEVQLGQELREDDIERLEDRYGRG
ncbi:MAG: phosphomannose isomerase type II C-terminal cupin domain [Rhodospirillales bacterium]|nr:phosphomannose isomerase type II C-terminal cupin domain [Rhodospirillales bacterium]